MSAKSQVDLSAEQVAVVSGQTTPESISPVTLGQMLQDIIDSMYNIVDTPLNRVQTFANAAARAAAVPDFTGQVGIQIDTRTIYTAYGTVAGNWKLPANTQDQSDTYAVATGTDAYAIALTPALTAMTAGVSVRVKFANANTGAATLQEGALAAKNIKKNGGLTLVAGDIQAGAIYTLTYDGVNWQIDNSGFTAASTNQTFTVKKTITSAQMLALFTTPIELIPAPGVGKAIQLISVFGRIATYGGTPYATNTTLFVYYTSDYTYGRMLVNQANQQGTILDSTITRACNFFPFLPNQSDSNPSGYRENDSVSLKPQTGNPTAGNSDVIIYTTYKIIDL